MIRITGDIHGNPDQLINYCKQHNLTKDDIIIILGDAGFNWSMDINDSIRKNKVKSVHPTFFCIHGNHEARPQRISTYKTKKWHGGIVYYEEEYSNLLFAKDGEIYDFDGKKCLVIGGAYSVDKYYRIVRKIMNDPFIKLDANTFYKYVDFVNGKRGDSDGKIRKEMSDFTKNYKYGYFYWFDDEQPDDKIKKKVEKQLENNKIDLILSHTCPYSFEPRDVFLDSVNQNTVDASTEKWLEKIYKEHNFKKWYCGHFHIDRRVDDVQFLFHTIRSLDIE